MAIVASLVQRKQNQNLYINTIKTMALIEAYQAAALKTYNNTDEIDRDQKSLEDQFQAIFGNTNLTDASDLGLTEETIIAVTTLRDIVREFLDTTKVTTAQVVDIKTPVLPVQLLSFIYYGSSDNTEEILDLNQIRNPSFVAGDVEILSE